ncbi:MAG: ATP-binding protein [Candidatus Freyarchaeota archaeon]|nr:ATP-binding protein [Candidatus Jordarchaeia archaeon]
MLARGLVQLDTDASFVVHFKPVRKKFGMRHRKRNTEPTEEAVGLWKVSCYTLLELDKEDELEIKILQVKNILSTVFSSSAERLKVDVVKGSTLRRKYHAISMKRFLGKPFELSSLKLSVLTYLPAKGVPGLNLKVKPEFNIPPEKILQGDGVKVGYVTFEDKKLFPFNLKLEHLRKGVAVLGSIGSGKTRMIMKVARDVAANYRIPILIFESKGEFASLIEDLPPDVLEKVIILRPGSPYAPLKINLFDPEDIMPEEYARRLFGLLNAVFRSMFREDSELTVQMSRVLSDVLSEALRNEKTRSIEGFFRVLRDYGKRETQNPNIFSTISALEARMNVFLRGILGEVFNTKHSNVSIDDLLRNMTIIDFSYLFANGGNKEDAQLIMNLVMLHVFQAGLRRMNVNTLSHLVIVDDARFLIPEIFVRRSTSDTTAIEDMITLERGKGQGLILICQDPAVSRIALANCNTRIVFRLSFKSQSEEEFIRMSLNLSEEQKEFLLTQPNRSAVVKIPEFPHPFPIVTQEYNVMEVSPATIERYNRAYHPYLFGDKERFDVNLFLEWIASVGPVSLDQVARQMKIRLGDAKEMIKKLEMEGYITLTNGLIFIKSS